MSDTPCDWWYYNTVHGTSFKDELNRFKMLIDRMRIDKLKFRPSKIHIYLYRMYMAVNL
jgi:hypothetical protein